jgi:hypothetical protein
MSKLVIYDPVYGGFFKKTQEFDLVRGLVRTELGDNLFKMGFSGDSEFGATRALKQAFKEKGIKAITPEGVIQDISYLETSDAQGNEYRKLRISLRGAVEELIISLDLGTDVAKRLIAKLGNYMPDTVVKMNAWALLEEKAGTFYVNHSVSMKTAGGVEVPALSGLFAQAKTNAENIISAAGITDRKVIDALKKSEQNKLFLHLLQEASKRIKLMSAN